MVSQENVKFSDAGFAESIPAPQFSFRPDSDSGSRLGDFLSRPVAIHSFSWAEGSTTAVQLQMNPWNMYFNTALIKNKINNFARIRCKLKLKFVVNASPFYFGAMRVVYTPISNGVLDAYETSGAQIKLSQLPGGFIYPADMTTFEMELPFLWPHAWLEVGTLSEFTAMGRLQYILYSKLRSANGSTSTNVNITCYAWAEDVELAGLTSGLSLQSDEYEESGVISGPASAVAKIAGRLTDAPVIGPLAMATQVGAQAVSSIASLFGFSNPPVINDVSGFQPKAFHAFSNVETSMPMDKLSVDPKNEVTIDRTVVGANSDDELVITTFAGKDSFLFGTLWTDAYAPGTQLLRFPVTPFNYSSIAGTSQSFINETPAAHAANMFRQWRGSMVYTLKFVKSRYHTGRVQISWDPQGVPGTNSETTTMTRIVDLQVETEVELVIPFKAVDAWLSTDNTANNWTNATAGTITHNALQHNGVVKVTVLNELTGPAASQELDILLFVHAGKDFRLSIPGQLPNWSSLDVQSLTSDLSVQSDIADGASSDVEATIPAVTVGESVVSLRSLLHRSTLWHSQWVGNQYETSGNYKTKSLYHHVNYIPRFPLDPGYNTSAMNYATGIISAAKAQYQFSPNHPMNWLGNCFAGYKGGIVHHFNVVTNGNVLMDDLRVERDFRTHILDVAPRQAINRFSVATPSSGGSDLSRLSVATTFGVNRLSIGHRGMSLTNTNTQTALSVVSPQYSRWKFKPCNIWIRDTVNSVTEYDSLKFTAITRGGMSAVGTDDGWPLVNIFVAGAVDFDLIHFLCVPTYRSFVTPTADNSF